jgi:hypothetical protein
MRPVGYLYLWEEERSALLPLPDVSFEAMRLDHAVMNNYAQFRFEKATYAVPQGKPRQKVLLSVCWDRIEVRNREGELLTTLPRSYMLKEQPIDWPALFEIYSLRPENRTPKPIAEGYTPLEVAAYDPDSTLYDQLLPTRLEGVATR